MSTSHPPGTTADPPADPAGGLRRRLLWPCVIIGLAATSIVLWLFGLTLWTAFAVMLLVACPLVVVWAWVNQWRQESPTRIIK